MAETAGKDDLAAILAQGAPRRRRGRWLLFALVLLAGLGGGGWYWYASAGTATKVSYTTDPVALGDLTVTVTATGTVEPTTQVDVSSELSGTLKEIMVTYNDRVTNGQILAELDDTKLAAQLANAEAGVVAARARVQSADATLREAAEALTTGQELDKRGVTTRNALTTLQAASDRAIAQLDIARADLTLAEANRDLVAADLAKAVIRSPIDGVVLSRSAEVGQIVAASLEAPVLFTLAEDLSQMQLLVDIDEADIGRVAEGNTAVFTVDAYDGVQFPAQIVQVRYAPETTDNVVTYKAVLAVENPEGLLRPGMTATATITVAEAKGALTVANAALRYAPPAASSGSSSGSGLLGLIMPRRAGGTARTGDGASIWVLRSGAPVQVAVQRGETNGRRTVITGEGLAEGDLAITEQAGGS
ncbi:efflux RND transporter periplasmic adaptor subunit [Tabrizicola fusiformis]|uniref:efflux RND transporter periplasmic adaptor subunit n=1 Tax=Tabrizicola sp. SY72 TaxID=2741673 RepID=UPI0015720E3E|nr:efflux RND transporter periplasmic adaptor subunit [Tabrizicola sp. SY72]NTT87300.1 efflux RND transporter periplasmic adaptor subunit [Tabrizicola sp. SY72]